MQNYSLTYAGIIVFVIGYIFKLAGVPFVEGDLQTTISFITSFIGVVMSIKGRYRQGDINFFGFKK